MKYVFGVSFNCEVDEDDIGSAGEGDHNVSLVSNDLDKLIAHVIADAASSGLMYTYTTDHRYVECTCSVGGDVVGVFIDQYGDVECVLVEFSSLFIQVVN